MNYITSDQHFFHDNIIKYCDRPFKNSQEMNTTMIENHNKVVKDTDNVICLGDLTAGFHDKQKIKDTLTQLNGNKILLKGNHDSFGDRFYEECGFVVKMYLIVGEIFLCHYPLFVNSRWTTKIERQIKKVFDESDCKYIVHGHNHNNFSKIPIPEWPDSIKRYNASVEVNNFTPVPVTHILNEFKSI